MKKLFVWTLTGVMALVLAACNKDADFLVFDKDLLTAEHEGFSYNLPDEVHFGGKRVN